MYARNLRAEHAIHQQATDVSSTLQIAAVNYCIVHLSTPDETNNLRHKSPEMHEATKMPVHTSDDTTEESWPFRNQLRTLQDMRNVPTNQSYTARETRSAIWPEPSRVDHARESREVNRTQHNKLGNNSGSITQPASYTHDDDTAPLFQEEAARTESSMNDRRYLKCLLSSSAYDYDSHAPLNFSWRPIPYKRLAEQRYVEKSAPSLPHRGSENDRPSDRDLSDGDSELSVECRPFWDINDNLAGRVDQLSPDRDDELISDRTRRETQKPRRAQNLCYAKTTRKALRIFAESRPLTPLDELSEPESDIDTPEFGIAKKVSIRNIKLSTQKAQQLRRMRSEEEASVADAEENGVVRVDSVIEKEVESRRMRNNKSGRTEAQREERT